MNKKKINKIPTTYVLFILIFVCIASLLLSAIKPKVFDPIRNNVSKIVIPLQEGINDIGKNLTHRRKVFAKVKKLEKGTKAIIKNGTYKILKEVGYVLVDDYDIENPKVVTVRKFKTEDHVAEAKEIIRNKLKRFTGED